MGRGRRHQSSRSSCSARLAWGADAGQRSRFLRDQARGRISALESVRLRRVLADVLVPMDIIVASEHRVQEWRDVRGSLIHAALTGGRELVNLRRRLKR